MPRLSVLLFGLATGLVPLCSAQNLICNASAAPLIVRGEGITERVGDIVLNCSGGLPDATISGNLSVFLSLNVTNRVSSGSVAGLLLTIDSGRGPQTVSTPATLSGPNNITYNGLNFTLSPSGTAVLRLANLRVSANQLMLMSNAAIQAYLGFNGGSLVSLTNTQLTVGTVARALYGGNSNKLVCAPSGSALPSVPSFTTYLQNGAVFASTRVTEGFADAFASKSAPASLNADTGTRIAVNYSGFPAGARLFVPDVVAGSDALQPTGAGDFGVMASGGLYAPSQNGSLLLARVQNNVPVYVPGPAGSGTVSFDNLSEVILTQGSGEVVYEIVDADNSIVESAQFPTFLGLALATVNAPVVTNADITLTPSIGDVIPRFQAVSAPNDCSIVGDCSAKYFPLLYVDTTPLSYTAPAGSAYQVAYSRILNQGGGVLRWTASVAYQSNGVDWMRLSPDSGTNNATLRLDALPGSLAPGVYGATVMVDGGPVAGTRTIPVTLNVTAPAPPVAAPPVLAKVVNAATFADGPISPGALVSILGSKLVGKSVAVTFGGLAAQVLFASDTQINAVVPATLIAGQTVPVSVTADGVSSAPLTVSVAAISPGIFGVLNQDSSANASSNPAKPGTVIQIFATGLGSGAISATGGTVVYAGAAPGLVGVQQLNLTLPLDSAGPSVSVSVCGGTSPVAGSCSPNVFVSVAP